MGDIGIDGWIWKMNEHMRKGHHIIKYPEIKNRANDMETDLLFKEQRIAFWEKNHSVPTANDLLWQESEVET